MSVDVEPEERRYVGGKPFADEVLEEAAAANELLIEAADANMGAAGTLDDEEDDVEADDAVPVMGRRGVTAGEMVGVLDDDVDDDEPDAVDGSIIIMAAIELGMSIDDDGDDADDEAASRSFNLRSRSSSAAMRS